MYKYSQGSSLQNPEAVVRISDGKVIQLNESDLLYKAVKLWMSRGNEPAPSDEEKATPVQEATPIEEVSKESSDDNSDSEGIIQPLDEHKLQSEKTETWRELLDRK